jgi:hypothetical protein
MENALKNKIDGSMVFEFVCAHWERSFDRSEHEEVVAKHSLSEEDVAKLDALIEDAKCDGHNFSDEIADAVEEYLAS